MKLISDEVTTYFSFLFKMNRVQSGNMPSMEEIMSDPNLQQL